MKSVLNRLTNLVTIAVVVGFIIALIFNISEAWSKTKEWDRSWSLKPNLSCEHSAQRIIDGMRRAEKDVNFDALTELRNYLNTYYDPIENTEIRLTPSELLISLAYSSIAFLFLFVPAIINYVINGRFTIWNRQAVKDNDKPVIHRYNSNYENSELSVTEPDFNGPATKTSGYAIASLVLGLVCLLGGGIFLLPQILAIRYGNLGLAQCRESKAITGRWMAVTGLVIGYICILLLVWILFGFGVAFAQNHLQIFQKNSVAFLLVTFALIALAIAIIINAFAAFKTTRSELQSKKPTNMSRYARPNDHIYLKQNARPVTPQNSQTVAENLIQTSVGLEQSAPIQYLTPRNPTSVENVTRSAYIMKGAVKLGPYKVDEFMNMLSLGLFDSESLFWISGMSDWKMCRELDSALPKHPIPIKPNSLVNKKVIINALQEIKNGFNRNHLSEREKSRFEVFCNQQDFTAGPFNVYDFMHNLSSGRFSGEDYFWLTGMDSWLRCEEFNNILRAYDRPINFGSSGFSPITGMIASVTTQTPDQVRDATPQISPPLMEQNNAKTKQSSTPEQRPKPRLTSIYYKKDGLIVGPLSLDRVKALLKSGSLNLNDVFAKTRTSKNWEKLHEIAHLLE